MNIFIPACCTNPYLLPSPQVKEDFSAVHALRSTNDNSDEVEANGRDSIPQSKSETDLEDSCLSICPNIAETQIRRGVISFVRPARKWITSSGEFPFPFPTVGVL